MEATINLDTAVTEALDDSIREAFSMMIGETLNQVEIRNIVPDLKSKVDDSSPALTVVVGIAGDLKGSVSITLSEAAACGWTNGLLDQDANSIDQTVVDAVGELGNIVVGGAKRRLSDCDLTMTLPNVLRVGSGSIVFLTGSQPTQIQYDFAGRDVSILVSLYRSTK